MRRSIQLAFGKQGLRLELPDGFEYLILDTKSAAPLDDAVASIESSLDNPTGSLPLGDLASGKKSAAISVCDITRPAPNRVVLPPVLRRLEQAGIPRDGITILVATGLHRPATPAEIGEIVGEEVASHYRVENHDARCDSDHVHLGATPGGTPIYIDRRFVEADVRMSLGFIEPHLMAGFSGGRKLVVPGLAGHRTIRTIHSPRFMRETAAIEGSIENNPLDRELREIAGIAGHQFIVDVALSRDRSIAAVFAGDPLRAHRAGVNFVARTLLQEIDEPVDAVITTSAGYPLDLTYYQTIKGITAASHIVRDGGRILLAGACDEGPGGAEFVRLMREYREPAAFMAAIEGTEVTIDQWQLEKLALVQRRVDVSYYVPGLSGEIRSLLWGSAHANIGEAVEALLAGLHRSARVAVIPEGPYVLAKVGAALVA